MVEEMRNKWCEDLEEVLQCPVCYERPKIPTLQCQRGHHICNSCKDQMTECPLCKSRFSDARSYLAEELSMKLDEIKLSLINPTHKINKKQRKSIASQTDASTIIDEISSMKRTAPPAPTGKFPCRLGGCNIVSAHGRMIPHIRYYHKNKFYESRCTSVDKYTQVWEMDYRKDTNFDLAIRVVEMGLFFMHIKIDLNGDLFGVVQIVSTDPIGRQFQYELKIESGPRSSGYKQIVRSCYTKPSELFKQSQCLSIKGDDMQRLTAPNKYYFSCSMTLIRLPKDIKKIEPIIVF